MSGLFPNEIFQQKYMAKGSANSKPMFDAPQMSGMNFSCWNKNMFQAA